MRGGPVPGSAKLTGSEVDLVSEVNEANVSLNRDISCRSLCSSIDIRELVRASTMGCLLARRTVVWDVVLDGDVRHFGVHPIDVRFVGIIDPFLRCLSDFVLYLPLGHLGFASRGDILNISHDTIHDRCFTSIIGRKLGSVMARLVTFKTSDRRRLAGFASLVLRGMV